MLLFDVPKDHPLAAWASGVGVAVMPHVPSCKSAFPAASATGAAWQAAGLFDSMLADLGALAGKLAASAAAAGAHPDSVLYMAADTLFVQDVNACSLAMPRVLSVSGGDPRTLPWASAGAYHINMSAWAELHPDLQRFGSARGWAFLGTHGSWVPELLGARVSALPETYDWQPWWGSPPAGTWGNPPQL